MVEFIQSKKGQFLHSEGFLYYKNSDRENIGLVRKKARVMRGDVRTSTLKKKFYRTKKIFRWLPWIRPGP